MAVLAARISPLRRVAALAAAALALSLAVTGLVATRAGASTVATRDVTGAVVHIYTVLGYQNGEAAGTGIVIDPSGLVLTNNHVIRGATNLRAIDVGNGRTYSGTVLGYSVADDVALVQLRNASHLRTAAIGGTVRVGATVTAYGNAGGAGGQPAVSPGKVTGLGKAITASDDQGGSERLTGLIRSDAQLEPGDSGGPLVDSSGKVVGMNTAASTSFQFQDTGSEAYAVPIGHALSIARQIQAGKASTTVHIGPTALLGITISSPSRYGYDGGGAYVVEVVPGSPAERAGLAAGSLITALGGKTIGSPDDLSRVMLRHAPKDLVALVWLDGFGSRSRATVSLASGPPL